MTGKQIVLVIFSLATTLPVSASWVEQLEASAAEIGALTEKHHEAAQKAFFQLSIDYPVKTDWLMQDAPENTWQILLPIEKEKVLTQVKATMTRQGQEQLATEFNWEGYLSFCEKRRAERIAASLKKWAPFVFTESHPFRMSFIGYTEGLSDARAERFFVPGTRLTRLDFEEGSLYGTPATLVEDERGMMRDVDVSFDRKELLFSWKKSDRLDDYHIYRHSLESGETKQITYGLGRADYEPVYLPDGDIIFASTRPEQSVPCWWTEISNLYRMDREGRGIRRLAIDQVHTLYPQVKADGRLTYTRWDYSDRGQNYPHPLFSMDPDGQGQRVFYGGNSWYPTSLLHARGIPGSHKVMAIAAGHHTTQNGKLVVLDVTKGRDEGVGMTYLANKREEKYRRVDADFQYGDQFRYPYPFSEDEFLVSYIPDYGLQPTWYFQHGEKRLNHSRHYGLYWMNKQGERELLYRSKDLAVQRPVAMGHKPAVQQIPESVDYAKKNGTYYVHDVYKGVGLKDIPRGEAKKIRVVEIDYRAAGVGHKRNHGEGGGSMNSTPVSIGNATWDIKRILGDVDIHEDGSALFEVPAMKSIYLQVLNEKGQVIQTTRTWDTVRPGEKKACVGCHDKGNANYYPFGKEDTLAWKQGPQRLQPFYGEPRGFSFIKEVQPILDNHCISCHGEGDPERMDLRGTLTDGKNLNKRRWSTSYLNLTGAKPDKRNDFRTDEPEKGSYVAWINMMSRPTELPPYFSGAAKSPLVKMLEEGHHDVSLSDEEKHKLYAWMDLLVPYVGEYREAHAWAPREQNFYDYFEGKRKVEAKEELALIADYLEGLQRSPLEHPELPASAKTRYRSLDATLEKSDSGTYRIGGLKENALIDALEVALPEGAAQTEVELKSLDGKRSFAKGLVTSEDSWSANFNRPLQIEQLQLVTSNDSPLTLTLLNGVLVSELPGSGSNRRHLQLGLPQ